MRIHTAMARANLRTTEQTLACAKVLHAKACTGFVKTFLTGVCQLATSVTRQQRKSRNCEFSRVGRIPLILPPHYVFCLALILDAVRTAGHRFQMFCPNQNSHQNHCNTWKALDNMECVSCRVPWSSVLSRQRLQSRILCCGLNGAPRGKIATTEDYVPPLDPCNFAGENTMGYQDELRKLPDVDPTAQHIARVVRDRIRTELSYLFDYPQYGQVTYRKSKNVFVFEFGGPGFHSDEADSN